MKDKCKHCGKEFIKYKSNAQFCSIKCFKLYKVKCPNCGSMFCRNSKNQKYCSIRCQRHIIYLNKPKHIKNKAIKQNKLYRKNNKENLNKLARLKYKETHPPIFIVCPICNKKFRKLGGKKYCSKKCRLNNPVQNEKYKISNRLRARKTNPQRKEYRQEYYNINKPKIRKKAKIYMRNKYNNDINFKIKMLCAHRIRESIKHGFKSKSTLQLIGCSIQHLRSHLESQFTEGMSWDNYGLFGWQIDHIVPCSSFDLSKPEEQEKCFHYTNLQPLWAKDNLSKSNKLDWSRD
jgi:hypothetical protein